VSAIFFALRSAARSMVCRDAGEPSGTRTEAEVRELLFLIPHGANEGDTGLTACGWSKTKYRQRPDGSLCPTCLASGRFPDA